MERMLAGSDIQVHSEVVTGFWNFQEFFAKMPSAMSGITIQEHGENVNHLFRFVLRSDLENYRVHKQNYQWEVHNHAKELGEPNLCQEILVWSSLAHGVWCLGACCSLDRGVVSKARGDRFASYIILVCMCNCCMRDVV